jgi:hypothetical protein
MKTPNIPLGAAEGEPLRRCPTCGVPYGIQEDDEGCPVCLLRRAMQPEARVEDNPAVGRFDHYDLVRREDGAFEELGRGSMGATYKAFDTVLRHPVALKLIDARVAADPSVRKRFLREARAAARLRHPNVASVFYYGVRKSDGQCFYAMELVEGETLEMRLRRAGPLPPLLALEVIAQVAKALVAAEAQGVVHRDLKPANLMLTHEAELIVKVIDFGLAKAAASADQTNLTRGGFVGTPAFASPEQCAGTGVDVRSDLYALGITLWQTLTGQTPFGGSLSEVKHQHLHAPLPLDQLKRVPQPAVMLLKTLLEKDPAHRFQNPSQLLQALPTVLGAIDAQRTVTRDCLQKVPPANSSGVTRKPAIRLGPQKISIARLPVTGSGFFGREEDLAFLDAAWADPQVNVVTIVAWAGVGKSTLINQWLRRLATKRYRSAELVFGWSFYRQGTSGDASSADEFLEAALTWFADRDPRIGTAWEKGERLAKFIAHRRTLLVLDGLEPLQNPPGPQEGRLREPSLQALLRELAAFNTGLCLITTRIPVADIANHEGTSALHRELERLSSDAGAKLLRALGVKGDEEKLRSASDEFSGHCLGLTLLGSFLTDAYNGDIRYLEEVSKRLAHDIRQGVHARKVMDSYQTWFGEGAELSVLRMLGLFDRPADAKVIGTLLKPPAIPGLTESLTGLSLREWQTILAKLRRARLVAGEDPHNPGHLDTHPLLREYFGEQLRSQRTEAWKESNRRLYNYYKTLAPQLPDSFREMEPLFLAVICGCNAGLFREALHEVYIPRIQRDNASFAANVLGARGPLLSVLIHFFERGRWDSSVERGIEEGQSLTAEDQLFILMQTGLYLTATRGFAAPEILICYERAESLCHSLNRPLHLYSALMGQFRHSLMTDKLTAPLQIAQRLYSLAQAEHDSALIIGANRALAATYYFLGDFEIARQHAKDGVQLSRSEGVCSRLEEINSPTVLCLIFEALCEWHFGKIAFSQAAITEAICLAKELNDTHALASALFYSGILGHFESNPAKVEHLASDLIEISARENFAAWLTGGTFLRSWARSASGNAVEGIASMEEGIEYSRKAGSILMAPYQLALKAEALHLADRTSDAIEAIKEAERHAEISEERWWCAELHRLRGLFLAALGADETQIEASFCEAIRIAKEQKSISLEKRAEATCAEYRRQKEGGLGGRGFRLPLC